MIRRGPRVAAVLAAALLALSSCGDDAAPTASGSSVPASAPYNQADVDFATQLIPHHAQALLLVDAAAPRADLSPRLVALVETIRTEQTGEIETMTDWLDDWGQPIPDNPRDHGGMDHDARHELADMPGMATEEEMAALADATGPAFEELWLELMIAHHRGAIEMAEAEVSDGEHPDAVELAGTIASSQAREIDQMERMLDG